MSLRTLALLFVLVGSTAHAAEMVVGAGSSIDLGSAVVDLGCADLIVAGTLGAGSGQVLQARDVTVSPGAVLDGNSAVVDVTGDWDNAGTFNAGTSTMRFVDGCGRTSAVITGDTTFANLDMSTTMGKEYQFNAGSTQTVTQFVSLVGAAGNRLRLRSTIDCVKAFIDNQGGSFGDFVDVDCIGVTTNRIFLGPNSLIGPNSQGMGFLFSVMVPALGALGLMLLVLSLLWSGRRAMAGRRGTAATP